MPERFYSADGTWWTEIRRGGRSNGEEICRHNPEHPIPAGEEYVEIVRSQQVGGGTESEGHRRYCLEHADAAIERAKSLMGRS